MQLARAFGLQAHELVALVGGGGKTTLMFRLAEELTAAGQPVVTTMTTLIYAGQAARAPGSLVLADEAALLAELPAALARHRHVLVAGAGTVEDGKLAGIPPDVAGRLRRQPAVGAVIVEADGARRLPFKAPAGHEPAVPAETTVLVPLVGLQVLGRPLTAEHVHRPELVAGLGGVAPGAPVTPELVARVLAHPQGGAKGLPAGAQLVPFLNQAEDPETLAAARQIARLLLAQPQVDSVAIGALHAAEPVQEVWGRTAAVVLAAGGAQRYGALKQLLPWGTTSLVAHVVDQALACPDVDRTVVTLGCEAAAVAAALGGRPVQTAAVPDWAQGQSHSVRAGLAAALAMPGGAVDAALFLLADQPGVSPQLLSALIELHRRTLAPVVAPRYQGRRGNPVLFDRRLFPEFAALAGDIGARPILDRHAAEIAWVDWPGPEIIQDIDRPADYLPPAP